MVFSKLDYSVRLRAYELLSQTFQDERLCSQLYLNFTGMPESYLELKLCLCDEWLGLEE